jgi:LacI family transcriptional regulator
MAKRPVRLKDVALATGFSANTVSLALRQSRRIPDETRRLILDAAARLNYTPNAVARALVSRRTRTVGLVLTDITNPTLTLTARCLERELAERGYSMMLAASDNDPLKEVKAIETFRERQVDGFLIYPVSHRRLDHIRRLRGEGHPVLLLVADPDAGLDAVTVDDRAGAEAATRHLIERGHRRIGFIDPAHRLGNAEKLDGFLAAHRAAELEPDMALVIDPGGHAARQGHRAMPQLMSRRPAPTALFCSNDSIAIGALSWCRENGLRVPFDLMIAGYDNTEAGAFAGVPLTTVDYASDRVSRLAVERLLALVDREGGLPEPSVLRIEPALIERRSTALA